MTAAASPTNADERFEVIPVRELPARPDGGTFEIPGGGTGTLVFGFRRAGAVCGRHYHRGLSSTKNPETFVLLRGTAIWRVVDLEDRSAREVTAEGPIAFRILPMLWHQLTAVTDVAFLELNSIDEHIADTFYDFDPDAGPAEAGETIG